MSWTFVHDSDLLAYIFHSAQIFKWVALLSQPFLSELTV